MIKELIDLFEKTGDLDQAVKDSYPLKKGFYVEIDLTGNILDELIVIDDKEIQTTNKYKKFVNYDFYSNMISANKAIDSKAKKVHSSNYLSVFTKLETVEKFSRKDLLGFIDGYYTNVLQLKDCPPIALCHKQLFVTKGENIYDNILEKIAIFKDTVPKGLNKILSGFYIKIFFKADTNVYQQELNRYLEKRIFLDNKLSIEYNNEILGVPSFDTTYNTGKPYLKSQTAPFEVSLRIPIEDAIKLYKIRIWLQNNTKGKNELYLPLDFDFKGEPIREPGKPCFYIQPVFGSAEFNILNATILQPIETVPDVFIRNYFRSSKDVDSYKNIEQIKEMISKTYFMGYMRLDRQYLIEQDASLPNEMKNLAFAYEEPLLRWFSGDDLSIRSHINAFTLKGCKILMKQNPIAFRKGYLLRFALMDHFEEKEELRMCNQLEILYKSLNEKMTTLRDPKSEMVFIENDQEFYYFSGQFIAYLMSRSAAKEKDITELKPFLTATKPEVYRRQLCALINNYSHIITTNKIKTLAGLVFNYIPETKPSDMMDYTVAGFFSKNIVYQTLETKEVTDNE